MKRLMTRLLTVGSSGNEGDLRPESRGVKSGESEDGELGWTGGGGGGPRVSSFRFRRANDISTVEGPESRPATGRASEQQLVDAVLAEREGDRRRREEDR